MDFVFLFYWDHFNPELQNGMLYPESKIYDFFIYKKITQVHAPGKRCTYFESL